MAVYACSDLHGYFNLYRQIKKFLKPEDKVYFLGDAGDRGPQSWKTMKAILTDPQFIYLKGNHEDMFVKACKEYMSEECWSRDAIDLCCSNGGAETLNKFFADTEIDKDLYLRELANLPIRAEYKNSQGLTIRMSHSGFWEEEYSGVEKPYLWDRNHWKVNKYAFPANTIIVHGHSPIQYMLKDWQTVPDMLWYCGDHKINIDSGTYHCGQIILLNLDTFDEHYFSIDAGQVVLQ